jgi:hypothetical protein
VYLSDEKKSTNDEGESDKALKASLKAWIQRGIPPPQVQTMESPTRAWFKEDVTETCISECLPYKRDGGRVLVSCDTSGPTVLDSKSPAQFGFVWTGNEQAYFPVEGDVVDFVPCRSTISGILRAGDVRFVKAKSDRITGTVEELGGKGGWIRPAGKLAIEFASGDVLSRNLVVGDLVDFKLAGEKGQDRATKVRVLQSAPPRPQTSTPPLAPSTTPQPQKEEKDRPRINQELIAQAPTATSAAASKTAPGPDGTTGFTKEKWRNKRLVIYLNAAAPEFTPTLALSTSAPADSPKKTTTTAKNFLKKEAPAFVPPSFSPPPV